MPSVPAAIIDTLNGLLEAEVNSVFRFVGEGSPYLDKATADVRKPLAELYGLSKRHARELADLIESLGGVPRVAHRVRPDEQYLGFLSMKFLLPKLVIEKDLIHQRYHNARATLSDDYPDVTAAITRIEDEQQRYLEALQRHEVNARH